MGNMFGAASICGCALISNYRFGRQGRGGVGRGGAGQSAPNELSIIADLYLFKYTIAPYLIPLTQLQASPE
jgi:hypothetical protein